MNYQIPDLEIYVTEKLADIKSDVEKRNLAYNTKRANAPLPGWVSNMMHDLSIWMICAGKRLHERYHGAYLQCVHQRNLSTR